jgi:hypothetical protein
VKPYSARWIAGRIVTGLGMASWLRIILGVVLFLVSCLVFGILEGIWGMWKAKKNTK